MIKNNALKVVEKNETQYLFDNLEVTYFYDFHTPDKIMYMGFDQNLNTCLQGNCNLETSRIDIIKIYRGCLPPQFKSYTKSVLEHLIRKFSFEPELIKFHDVREKRFINYAKEKSPGIINLGELDKEKVKSIPFFRALDDLGYKNIVLGNFDKNCSEEFYRVKYLEGRK